MLKRQFLKDILFGLTCSGVLSSIASPANSAPKKDKGSSDSPFMAQSQVTATVMRAMRPIGIMQVDVGLYVTDASQRPKVSAMLPIFKSTWRATVQEFVNQYYTPGRMPDAMILGDRLQAATDKAFGKKGLKIIVSSLVVR